MCVLSVFWNYKSKSGVKIMVVFKIRVAFDDFFIFANISNTFSANICRYDKYLTDIYNFSIHW